MAYWSCRPQIIRHPTTLVTMETRISKRGCIPVPSFTLLLGAGTARLQTQAKASKAGGLMKLRHPAPKSFMNRQEAIQSQIDDIMDSFDFQCAMKVLEAYKSIERGYPADWFMDGEPFEPAIRASARDCMKAAVKEGYAGHSYFEARFVEKEDDDGPWVRIDFNFGDHTHNDGTGYEK